MKFLEDILDYFGEEILSEGLDIDYDIEIDFDGDGADFSFFDNGSDSDNLAIQKIQEHYGLDAHGSEEFLKITQSIQHSLGALADEETLANIDDYIDNFNMEPKRMVGLVNNVKGIYGEHKVIEVFRSQFNEGEVILRDYATNTPDVDLTVFDKDGITLEKIQVKVSNNPNYILSVRDALADDVTIVTTDEVIEKIIEMKGELPDGIRGVGLSCDEITSSVERTINILNTTEPEFDMIITNPVISEHLSQGSNPFQVAEESFGRKVHADKRYNHPVRWVYGSGQVSGDFMDGTVPFEMDWSLAEFTGIGNPSAEAVFFKSQQSEFSCALVTQRNIIESLTGVSLSEEELIEYALDKGIYDPNKGTLSSNLTAILRQNGLICQDYNFATFEMLENALIKGDKVMVGLDASEILNPLRSVIDGSVVEQEDLFHCLQVTGIDYSDSGLLKVILSDSSSAERAIMAVSIDDFMAAWEDANCRLTIVTKR
jgi:hypothetical protein